MHDFLLHLSLLAVLAIYLWVTKNKFLVCMVWAVFIGIACNKLVVMSNRGLMPVFLPHGLEYLASDVQESSRHTVGDEATKLAFLSDWIDVPHLDSIVSIGDVLMTLSLFLLLCLALYGGVLFSVRAYREGQRKKLLGTETGISPTLCLCTLLAVYLALFLNVLTY